MCLAIPMKILEVDGLHAVVQAGDGRMQVRLDLLDPPPRVGQYLLVHAGLAIQSLDEEGALETIKLIRQAYLPPERSADSEGELKSGPDQDP